MTEVKHTPGPWRVFNGTDVFPDDDDTEGTRHIADCNMGNNISSAEAKANACLIAAAPDLLEAGNKVLNYATLDGILSDESRHADSVFAIRLGDLRELRAAIAKAEGRA